LLDKTHMMLKHLKKHYQLKITTGNFADLLLIRELLISSSTKKEGTMLPKKKKRFTLIRSPHVNKKSKEHFQIVKYRRLYNIYFFEKQLQEFLRKIPNSSEVCVKSII
jgi:ribosomal protein S10